MSKIIYVSTSDETFIFSFAGQKSSEAAARLVCEFAAEPTIGLTWHEAALLNKLIRKLRAKEILLGIF